MPLWWEKQQHK